MAKIVKNLFEKITFYEIFFALFFFSLVSGPLIPEILIFLLIVYYFQKKKSFQYDLKIKKIFYFLIGFYLYLNLNTFLVSFDAHISAKSTLPYIRYILFSYIICMILLEDESKKFINIIIKSYFILLTLLILDSFFQLWTGKNILGYTYQHGRITSFFGSEQILGSFIIRTLPVVISIFFIFEKLDKRFAYVIIFLSTLLVFLSAERTALAYTIAFLILFIFIEIKSFKKFLLLGIFVFILTLFSINFFEPLKTRVVTATLNQIKSSSFFLIPSYRHELHYSNAISIFRDNFVFGKGIKSFRYICGQYDSEIIKKIDRDKAVLAPFDGNAILATNSEKRKIIYYSDDVIKKLVPGKNFIEFYFDKDFRSNYLNLNKKIFLVNDYEGQPFFLKENFQLFNQKNKILKIKKGDFLYSNFEFSTGCNTHPHNVLLQFLAELGILGGIFFIISFAFLLMNFIKLVIFKLKNRKLDVYEKGIYIISASLILSILPLFPSGNFFNNWLSMIFFFKLGILLFFLEKNKLQ